MPGGAKIEFVDPDSQLGDRLRLESDPVNLATSSVIMGNVHRRWLQLSFADNDQRCIGQQSFKFCLVGRLEFLAATDGNTLQ